MVIGFWNINKKEFSDNLIDLVTDNNDMIKVNDTTKNIWDSLDFSENSTKSSYNYLSEQAKYLTKATSGDLKMDVEAVNAYIDPAPPKLGNY